MVCRLYRTLSGQPIGILGAGWATLTADGARPKRWTGRRAGL